MTVEGGMKASIISSVGVHGRLTVSSASQPGREAADNINDPEWGSEWWKDQCV